MKHFNSIRVAIADDSLFVRRMLRELLSSETDINVVGEAKDGEEAVKLVKNLKPDVLLLDIIMPNKDGLSALEEIMQENPIPVVVFSALTKKDANTTFEALEKGAIDFILKPGGLPVPTSLEEVRRELITKVRIAAYTGPVRLITKRLKEEVFPVKKKSYVKEPSIVVVIGASTGGPSIVEYIVSRLPQDLPATVFVVQHMPALFTKVFADRLDKNSSLRVKEAEDGEKIVEGCCYVAPGDYHMIVDRKNVIHLDKGPKVHGVRPSVDVTMKSVAEVFGSRSVGVVLTGMGWDGAEGAYTIRKVGGFVIAQDKKTSIVYGMPKAVVDVGAANMVLPYHEIPSTITRLVKVKKERGGFN